MANHPYARAPFPAFGGKSAVADLVWARLGPVRNFSAPTYDGANQVAVQYEEPFANSIAILLANPQYDWGNGRWRIDHPPLETVNDKNPYISNAWRALQTDPEQTAYYADWPVSEIDLHARHAWLVKQAGFREAMREDPDYCDFKIAGWWIWGASLWIGSGWCDERYWSGNVRLELKKPEMNEGRGVNRKNLKLQRPHLADAGRGVHRRPPVDTAPHISGRGQGIHKGRLSQQVPLLNGQGQGVHSFANRNGIYPYFEALSNRLRYVRVLCGDWSRAVTNVATINNNSTRAEDAITAVVLDPPYSQEAGRAKKLYATDSLEVAHLVRNWCLEWVNFTGEDIAFEGPRYQHPKLRIVLFGYEDEHVTHMPTDWECVEWEANGGFSNQNKKRKNNNRGKERIWFSPNCLKPEQQQDLPLLGYLEHLTK